MNAHLTTSSMEVSGMVSHRNRLKSIHTPPRRDKVSPSKRQKLEDEGPTPFALQRQAEVIGASTYCELNGRGTIGMVKQKNGENLFSKQWAQEAEFASSSALARIFNEARITSQQYRAGINYARLYRLIWGRAVPKESSLTKVMATSFEDRDDEDYAEWLAERRAELEHGERALNHIVIHVPANLKVKKKGQRENVAHALIVRARAEIRLVVRKVCIDGQYIHRTPLIVNLQAGLDALREEWGIK